MAKATKYIYHIIITSNGKELKDIYHCVKESSAYEKFNAMVKENKETIKFPVKYINNKGLKDANYELVIIKSKEEKDPSETKIRDEYGRYINYISSSSDWIILHRVHFDREETFWVYGFHPQTQRKTFQWIMDNFISKDCDKLNFKQVMVFRNKLIIDTNGNLEMVLCKNREDCIRLYNQLEEEAKKAKLKYIFWCGDMTRSQNRKDLIKRLLEWTGWSYDKLRRNSLRP